MSFSNSFKNGLFAVDDRNFNEKALELFSYQAENNAVYKNYLKLLKVDPAQISDITQIPFLPIQLFKTQKILTGDFSCEGIFYSSGTTGEKRSSHYIRDLSFYKSVSEKTFLDFYGVFTDYAILALLPGYRENKSSSLIYMIHHFIEETGNPQSGFMLEDLENIEKRIDRARKQHKKIILWGVSFALLDLAERFPMDLSDVIVIETGGMKGRREEMTREELHEVFKRNFKVSKVHSEYGMTELLSQAYSKGDGLFKSPKWMKVLIREIQDPFSIHTGSGRGGINIIDLANVDSCAFIETQDLGSIFGDRGFEIRGRFDNSDVRGCNLLYMS